MWPIVLVCFFMIHQGASEPLTQEDIDKWMPYIMEKMETKFDAESIRSFVRSTVRSSQTSIQKEIIEMKKGINECHTNPCQNQGTCTDMPSGYHCSCVPGFIGKNCEVTSCDTNPCKNQGICTDVPSGYTCTCVPGFTGKNCEVNFDECSENPCGVHGTCTDLINSYKCVCETGYSGLNCDSTCPTNDPNYHLLNDHCIFLEKSYKTYEDAKQNCETKFGVHGKLFEPKTWSENQMAYKIAKAIHPNWWIGVNDKQTEGSYVYESNGLPISYTPKFRYGFGSRGTFANCILYRSASSGHESDIVHWVDYPCSYIHYSICENSA